VLSSTPYCTVQQRCRCISFSVGVLAVKASVGAWAAKLFDWSWLVTEHVRAVAFFGRTTHCYGVWLSMSLSLGGLHWLPRAGHISPLAAANWEVSIACGLFCFVESTLMLIQLSAICTTAATCSAWHQPAAAGVRDLLCRSLFCFALFLAPRQPYGVVHQLFHQHLCPPHWSVVACCGSLNSCW
jgi:hypothetical protein